MLQVACKSGTDGGGNESLKANSRERRRKAPRLDGPGKCPEVVVRKGKKLLAHVAMEVKNSTPRLPTVGTTRARSRNSLCCSHEVSAISTHPWQAAPWRKRCSCGFSGSCWAHTGSLEHSSPSSRAALRCSWILRPTWTSPPSV